MFSITGLGIIVNGTMTAVCLSVEADVDLYTDQVDTNFSSCVHGDIPTESPRVPLQWLL